MTTQTAHPRRSLVVTLALGAAALGVPQTAYAAPAAPPLAPSAAGLAAASSSEGSLLFVRDYDVWIAQVDGTRARPLTTDGTYANPYHSPTQSDGGVVVVAHAGLILRMNQQGKLLGTINPPALMNSLQHAMDGTPSTTAISPDGRLIAFTQAQYECASVAGCDTRFATAYTAADHLTDPALHSQSFGDSPGWINAGRTVQGGGSISDIRVGDVDGSVQAWFRDSQISSPARDLTQPAVSRNGRYVAAVRGWGTTTSILWSRVTGSVQSGTPSVPEPICETNEEPVATPAWSADSRRLAWSAGTTGIYETLGIDPCGNPTLIVRGGTEPSFSAAPWTAAAPSTGTGSHAGTHAPVSLTRPIVKGKPKVGRKLRAKVGSWTPGVTSYAIQWRRGSRVIPGATRATYRVKRKDVGKKIRVRITATGPGGSGRATSRPVKVRR